jgi:HEAT repeat protein
MGPKALKHIQTVLENKELRHYGLVLIGRMGPAAQEAVPALVKAIGQAPVTPDDVEFVREAQFALASIGPMSVTAVPALVKSLSSTDETVQASAAFALGKIGAGAIGAVPALRQSLRSESFIVRLASVRALLEIQPGQPAIASIAAPLLRQALSHPRPMVRAESARAIAELGELGKQAIPDVKKLLQDEDPMVREAAQATLQKLGG